MGFLQGQITLFFLFLSIFDSQLICNAQILGIKDLVTAYHSDVPHYKINKNCVYTKDPLMQTKLKYAMPHLNMLISVLKMKNLNNLFLLFLTNKQKF